MDASAIFNWVGFASYFMLAGVALWGAYFVVLVLGKVGSKRFKSEDLQDQFLDSIEQSVREGNFDAVQDMCRGDKRALPMMINLACANRAMGYAKTKQYVLERFQRDVLGDADIRIAWVITVIKTAPMLGLFGTVVGMMGAFGKLASMTNVNPTQLAGDIRVALETTAIGLTIAIPLVMCMASINNRLKQMQDLVGSGLTRFFDAFKEGVAREERRGGSRQTA
jgi:biopolymer transport protein ExbB